jgi:hypothetical protein
MLNALLGRLRLRALIQIRFGCGYFGTTALWNDGTVASHACLEDILVEN